MVIHIIHSESPRAHEVVWHTPVDHGIGVQMTSKIHELL